MSQQIKQTQTTHTRSNTLNCTFCGGTITNTLKLAQNTTRIIKKKLKRHPHIWTQKLPKAETHEAMNVAKTMSWMVISILRPLAELVAVDGTVFDPPAPTKHEHIVDVSFSLKTRRKMKFKGTCHWRISRRTFRRTHWRIRNWRSISSCPKIKLSNAKRILLDSVIHYEVTVFFSLTLIALANRRSFHIAGSRKRQSKRLVDSNTKWWTTAI